jgi:hypothetical protein
MNLQSLHKTPPILISLYQVDHIDSTYMRFCSLALILHGRELYTVHHATSPVKKGKTCDKSNYDLAPRIYFQQRAQRCLHP